MTTCLSTTSFPPAVVQRQPLWNERRLVARRPHRPRQSSRLNCQAWITTLVCCLLVLVRSTDAHQLTGLTRMHARNEPADLASTTIRPSGSATATGSVQVASDISTALPRPFDSNIGNNFTTASCPAFFDRFLGHGSFIQCLPLSLLLQTSNGFFTASRSLVRLTTTLDATCDIDFPQCSALMAQMAQDIRQTSTCGSDLAMGNPTVVQAYNGLLAYDTLYHAGCLNDANGSYCYANAVTNTSAPTSSYIYYLPLGVQLPGGSRPACTTCLQDTMAIFAQSSGNVSSPLHEDYASAAEQVQMSCGPSFVQTSVQLSSSSSAPTISLVSGGGGVSLAIFIAFLTFCFLI